jgi:glutathione-independent formaldehyde dehydrogenase
MRPGEESMMGVMCGIEAVGYQATAVGSDTEQPNAVLESLIRLVNPTGRLGIPGLYVPRDAGAVNSDTAQGRLILSFGKLFENPCSPAEGMAGCRRS